MEESQLASQLTALASVVMIDIVLAGDNAVVVGTAAAGLPPDQQRRVIAIGSGLALVARVAFALIATYLLSILGLVFAGGLLLLWVSWKIWRDLRSHGHEHASEEAAAAAAAKRGGPKTFRSAIIQVAVADISMSLDNVLAVAGAARDHPYIMVFGLVLSIALMAVAAGYIAKLIDRYRWVAYVGFVIVLFVALRMMWEGGHELLDAYNGAAPAHGT